MGEDGDNWTLHRKIALEVPTPPGRIGYAALQQVVEVGQRGRVKRAVSTLVGLDVLQWAGQRNGRAVTQGPRDLDSALAEGLIPMPEREIQTYPLLAAPLDAFITAWHQSQGHTIDEGATSQASGDGVTTYNTSSLRAGDHASSSAHTRPDLTVVVDLLFPHLGAWNDVHAVEVKPYWAVTRAALFEAAAQAALGRCTFSWLLLWIPDPQSGHFTAPQVRLIREAEAVRDSLTREASQLGLGLLLARDLSENSELQRLVEPQRRVMDPDAADSLFASLNRNDGSGTI